MCTPLHRICTSFQLMRSAASKRETGACLKHYWEAPPRNLAGAVHSRYMADFGSPDMTRSKPRMRPYLTTMTSQPHLETCQAAELLLQLRLETLPLNAFHSHSRPRESASAHSVRELCPSCKSRPESPAHFLLECPAYSSIRSLPEVAACIAGTEPRPNQAIWRALLDSPAMAPYLNRAWKLRRAALTGRGANGASSMALTPVPGADIIGEQQ
jgi:hypothetical protein